MKKIGSMTGIRNKLEKINSKWKCMEKILDSFYRKMQKAHQRRNYSNL
ncbi:hypothetical protein [Fusobacterium gonidiaformans]|nr:hypothetical protein [Fusobacterium gonidiaformans]EFS27811.1 hypothetical protein FGAG_00132 [Fusobacterium gonidiaformans ATCC 25563]